MDSVPTQAGVEAKVEDYITLVSGLVVNPHRLGRVEPRCKKRRAKKYPYMKRPRRVLRQRLLDQRVPA